MAFLACGRFKVSVVMPGWDGKDWRNASWVLTEEMNLHVVTGCCLAALRRGVRSVLVSNMRRIRVLNTAELGMRFVMASFYFLRVIRIGHRYLIHL
jgi:hypothetical protein